MVEPLRLAVVGVGHLGKEHARLYREMPGVELVAVADVSESTARKIAKKNKTEVRTLNVVPAGGGDE